MRTVCVGKLGVQRNERMFYFVMLSLVDECYDLACLCARDVMQGLSLIPEDMQKHCSDYSALACLLLILWWCWEGRRSYRTSQHQDDRDRHFA